MDGYGLRARARVYGHRADGNSLTHSLALASPIYRYIHAPDERFRTSSLYMGQDAYLSMILSAAEAFGGARDEL